jgi:hypothetical protein
MKKEYVFVEHYQAIFKFSPRKFRRVLEEVAAGREVDFNKFGKFVGVLGHNVTDMDEAMAKEFLKELKD